MLKNRIVQLVLACALVYLTGTLIHIVVQDMRLKNYNKQLESELIQAKSENSELESALLHYKTDKGVEELARKRLGYYKKDEIPLRVIESSSEPAKFE